MRGRYKSKENAGSECIHAFEGKRDIGNGLFRSYDSPMPGELASYSEGPNSPNGGLLTSLVDGNGPSTMNSGPKCSNYDGEKRYLGVRVKMPVRDMLNKIRIAKGMDPQNIQGNCGKALKGEKKRVNTNRDRRSSKRKQPTKSLEELAIIVEVLEEDLKASKPYSQSNTSESPDYSPEPNVQPWNSPEQLQHSHSMKFSQENKMPQQATNYCMSELKLSRSAHNHNTSVPPLNSQGRCINDESDNMMPSPDSYMTYSPSSTSECQVPSPQYSGFASPLTAYFWNQLQREESLLTVVSDTEVLATDRNGRTALHRVVGQGKRALGYVIAKRMAALNRLDVKDTEGKVNQMKNIA
ncbi:unnamed protein product [Oncorhynchus mykiss]|uniref:OCA domain-containing protein n=1 Tax=Oncorhynchus mykiss TaxID=8022 RepID=A0A060WNT2_ONCMY|nr:unnamed protein product [Oncorhynchus mykiss]